MINRIERKSDEILTIHLKEWIDIKEVRDTLCVVLELFGRHDTLMVKIL